MLFATIVALVWANSPYGHIYNGLWQYELGIITDGFEFKKPLILWINDGLMAVFFFLIGLEIKRELLIGELNSVKKVAFPLVGALGGMLIGQRTAVFLILLPFTYFITDKEINGTIDTIKVYSGICLTFWIYYQFFNSCKPIKRVLLTILTYFTMAILIVLLIVIIGLIQKIWR